MKMTMTGVTMTRWMREVMRMRMRMTATVTTTKKRMAMAMLHLRQYLYVLFLAKKILLVIDCEHFLALYLSYMKSTIWIIMSSEV